VTKAGALRIAHALSAFALTAQIAWEASEWVGRITPAHTAWVACVAALPAIAYLAAVARWRNVALWPMSAHGDAYALQLPGVSDQLADFERLAHAAGREQGSETLRSRLSALDRYAGDLLPEVGPAEWVVDERNRLRLLAASVGSAAARDALAAGELRTALDAARRSVALDPYHDSSWQLVVEINERLGDQSAAAVARRDQARIWADLGLVAPGAAEPRSVARRS